MPDNLKEGTASIIPLNGLAGPGVNLARSGIQRVIMGAPVTEWGIKKVEGKENTYLLSVGNYISTIAEDDAVFASIQREQAQPWIITYCTHQDAYTIAVAESPNTYWWVEGDPSLPMSLELHLKNAIPHSFNGNSQGFRFEYLD